jgi:hypothetical protein
MREDDKASVSTYYLDQYTEALSSSLIDAPALSLYMYVPQSVKACTSGLYQFKVQGIGAGGAPPAAPQKQRSQNLVQFDVRFFSYFTASSFQS